PQIRWHWGCVAQRSFLPKNLANTNVLWWGGRLLALWEGGRPHLMDPLSLATSRESDLAGLLKPGETFSAHPRFDRARKRLVNFAYSPNPLTGTKLTFFEFGENFRPVHAHPSLVTEDSFG
ncbi:retinal pigment epithelial membrane protein-domain-containing protein, partial [Pavlovales sp. CCMP2436]